MLPLISGRSSILTAVLIGGGIAATLDITYAIVVNGWYERTPLWVLQSVASGWLGMAAFSGGIPAGVLGLVSHYSILFVAALIYYAATTRVPILRTQAVVFGALFGVAVYLFMNFVVIPLSAFPFKLSYPLATLLRGFTSHAAFVGVPIAVSIRRFTTPGGDHGREGGREET